MRIAMCIPTYNHEKLIRELIEDRLSDYEMQGIDLFVCDSSSNQETEQVIKNVSDLYQNIKYIRYTEKLYNIPTSMHSNTKVFWILSELSTCKEYDYIWVCGDALRFNLELIQNMVALCKRKSYDYVVIGQASSNNGHIKEYDDYRLFFLSYAWWMTYMGVTIVKRSTVLENLDWDYYKNKYLELELYNFSHVCLYAERAKQLQVFNAVYIEDIKKGMTVSPYKIRSTWLRTGLEIWLERWPAAINALPYEYSEIKYIINSLYINSSPILKSDLLYMRSEAILTYDYGIKRKNELCTMTGISEQKLIDILCMSQAEAREAFLAPKYLLEDFVRSHSTLMIYGAGQIAKKYSYILSENNIAFDCFLVTKKRGNEEMLMGHEIRELKDFTYEKGGTGILLGLGEKNKNEVKNILKAYVEDKDLFDDEIDCMMI